jgi:hypothetical protein
LAGGGKTFQLTFTQESFCNLRVPFAKFKFIETCANSTYYNYLYLRLRTRKKERKVLIVSSFFSLETLNDFLDILPESSQKLKSGK